MTKAEFRRRALNRRAAVTEEKKLAYDAEICRRIAGLEVFRNADTVLLYASIKGEIDLSPLVSLCHNLGKTVAFPTCDPESEELYFRTLSIDAELSAGTFGIPEPPADAPLCPISKATLCVLPGLSFDARGNRIGYGKGYYDRFLQSHSVVRVGAVYEELTVRQIPTEPHDLPVDLLVTERGVIDCARQRDRYAAKAADEPSSDPASTPEESVPPAPLARRVQAPLWLTLILLGLLSVSRLIDPLLTARGAQYAFVLLSQLLIFVGSAAIYLRIRREPKLSSLRLRLPRLGHLWFCFCGLAVMVLGSLLISIATGGIESLGGNFTLYHTFVARINGSAWETVYVILAYAILPAFCEELIFRSLICAEYEADGVGISLLMSSLLFSMLHASFPLLPNYLFLGFLLAGVAYTTRSVIASMLLHCLYNIFCLFGQPYLSAFYVNAGSGEIFVFCLVVLFLLFAAFGAGEARKIYHLYAKANLASDYTVSVRLREYPKRLLHTLGVPVFAILLAFWIALSIMNLIL